MSNSPVSIPASTPYRILIVDDEEIVLVALRETLSRNGYQVMTAPNPLPALEALKKEIFSVVITDQQMPMMSGLEFLGRVKQIQPDSTRILITAVLSLDTVIEAINKGEIYRFIVKPWTREDLLTTVKNAVQRHDLICKNVILQATTMAMNDKLAQLNQSLEQQMALVEKQNEQLAGFNDALGKNLRHSVQLCVRTMETFYPTLGSQARRVFQICNAIADGLRLPPQQRQALEISAWLYDIGLVGLPRQLIKRWQEEPATLTETERALIRQHPITGQEMAVFADGLGQVGAIIRAHHERFDGQGYPDKLAGEKIPQLARLLAIAVAYAESHLEGQAAAKAIEQASGKAFDPEAVQAFLGALPRAVVPRKEREVPLAELRPGMVPARGIYTTDGLLLIPEGQPLSANYIEKLLNHERIDPINQSVVVYC